MCYDAELSVANRRGAGRVIQIVSSTCKILAWHVHLILELRYREACAVLSGMLQAIRNTTNIYSKCHVSRLEEYFIALDIHLDTGNWDLSLFVVLPSLFRT